jgi:parallel beta-helix repeat protein
VFVLRFVFGCLLVSVVFFEVFCALVPVVVGQSDSLRVHNLDSGLSYAGIQEAVNAVETLNGHTLQVGAGVFREHVTVNKSLSLVGEGRDVTIVDGGGGGFVVFVQADDVEVRGFSIRNGTILLWLNSSDGSRVFDNSLSGGPYGLRLYHSRDTLVVGNRVSGCRYFGVELYSSGNSTLRDNALSDNVYNFGVDGRSLPDFLNDVDVSNTVNGKPIRYLVNQRDMVVDRSTLGETGYLGFVNSSNIELRDLIVSGNVQGILLAFDSNSSVSGVIARSNWNGVYVAFSSNVSVSDARANGNFDYGIKFFNCSNSRAFRNNASNNGWAGIGLFGSPFSVVDLNEVNYATYDLHLVYTNDSLVTRNTAIAKAGGYSIALYYSHNNLIYHNTFLYSLLFAEQRGSGQFVPVNSWDNGVDGNFWMTYGGRDSDEDGIGDTVFRVGENNFDNKPLMGRFLEFPVVFDGKEYGVSLVSNSAISGFSFDVDDRAIVFSAIGQNGTSGFCRVAVSNSLIYALKNESLSFVIDASQVVLVRSWSDLRDYYWYFSYVHVAGPGSGNSGLWFVVIMVSAVLVSVGLLAVGIFRQRRRLAKAEASM